MKRFLFIAALFFVAGWLAQATGQGSNVAGVGSPAFSGGAGLSFQDAALITAPGNPGAGNLRLFANSGTNLLDCKTSGGASCMPSAAGATFQVNGVNTTSQATINFQNSAAFNGLTATVSNPSAGNVQLGFSGTLGNGGLTNSSVTVNTTAPLSGGGSVALGSSITASCPTCVTSAAALTNKGVVIGQGGQAVATIDFPDVHMVAAANCNNATAGTGWSLPTASAPTAACRTGTNIQDGVLQFVDSQSAQFSLLVPLDWDSATNPSARLYGTQAADATAAHTIIFQLATSCSSSTDDAAFNAAQSFATATSTATANTPFSVTLSNFTMTGCAGGQLMHVKISRTTDGNVSANVYQVAITFPRLLTVQAN